MSKSALIIGASRGLGLGLVQQLQGRGWQVTATVRDPHHADALKAVSGVQIEQLDVDSSAGLDALAARLVGRQFDLILVNAGIAGPTHQSASQVTSTQLEQLFLTNTVAPIRLAERFIDQVAPDGTLAFMSSILGSVAANDMGSMPLYSASKAALNSLTRSFVSSLGLRAPTVLSLHPGWVKTDMGGADAQIDVLTSTRGMVEQLEAYAGRGGHHFIDYQGTTLPW